MRLPDFGRELTLEHVLHRLDTDPLVTVAGVGGAGKTHFAQLLARRWRELHRDLCTWVELAPITQEELVPQAVCAAAGISLAPGQRPLDTLTRHFRDQPALLLLDNCEHVLDATAELVAELTTRCPALRVLATSRDILDVPGETIWRLEPLGLPAVNAQESLDPSKLAASPAIALFLDRARRARPDFAITPDNAALVLRLCERLEGLPLALELAAAQLRAVPLAELDQRLASGIGLLQGHRHGVPDRHATMQAALAGSVEALSPDEAQLFDSLAVFRGAFSLAACQAVCRCNEQPDDLLVCLAALVNKSLVLTGEDAGADRYRLLEPVRQYAQERLQKRPEANVEARFIDYFAEHAMAQLDRLCGADRERALTLLDADLGNLRQAWALAIERSHTSALDRLARSLFWYWHFSGRLDEGYSLCHQALHDMKPAAEEEGFLVYVMGALEWVRGDYDRAHGWLTRAERHARCVQNPALLGAVLRASAGVALATRREDEAQAMSREAIDCLQHAGCRWDAALAATHEADACEALGQVDAALNVRRQALTCFEALGDPWGRSVCLFGLALGHARQGRFRPARREVHEALAIQQSGGDAWNIAQCLILLADIELAESQYDQASLNLVRSLAELRQVRDRVAIAYVLPRLAAVEYGRRQHTRAATLLGAADTPDVRSAAQYPLRLINDGEQDDLAGQLTAALGEAAFESARSRGMALDLDGAVAMAMGELAAATSDSHSPTPDLRIRLLGKPAIWCGSQRLTAADWTYALPRVLLYYLLLNGPVSKERLGVDLWPDASSSQLRGRFRTTLYQLRKALGDPRWIRYVDGHYAFDDRGSATVDYREFERCTAAGLDLQKSDPERALELLQRGLALYRGTLLEGEDIGGWVVDHQQRLAARCFKVALACSELLAESGRDREACESLVLAVALEPFDEHAVTALAETYWRLGDRTAALRALDALAQRLAEELAVRPQACTRELRQRIARGEDVPPYLSR